MLKLNFSSENPSNSFDFHHLPIEFHENFLQILWFSVSDFETMKMDTHFVRGKIDEKYLAHLFLNGTISLWKNISRSDYQLTDSLSHFKETFVDIKRYFTRSDYSAQDLQEYNENFSGIIHHLLEKFSKSSIISDNTQERVHQTIIQF